VRSVGGEYIGFVLTGVVAGCHASVPNSLVEVLGCRAFEVHAPKILDAVAFAEAHELLRRQGFAQCVDAFDAA
jgi:hypothetical protein